MSFKISSQKQHIEVYLKKTSLPHCLFIPNLLSFLQPCAPMMSYVSNWGCYMRASNPESAWQKIHRRSGPFPWEVQNLHHTFNVHYCILQCCSFFSINLVAFLLRQNQWNSPLCFLLHEFPKQRCPTAKSLVLPSSRWAAEPTAGNPRMLPTDSHKTGGEKGWAPLHQKEHCQVLEERKWHGICPLEPSASHSFMNTFWKLAEPEIGSLELALVGWATLVFFFLQRSPAQKFVYSICHMGSHLPRLPVTLVGSGNQTAMSPDTQLQVQHAKPTRNA